MYKFLRNIYTISFTWPKVLKEKHLSSALFSEWKIWRNDYEVSNLLHVDFKLQPFCNFYFFDCLWTWFIFHCPCEKSSGYFIATFKVATTDKGKLGQCKKGFNFSHVQNLQYMKICGSVEKKVHLVGMELRR